MKTVNTHDLTKKDCEAFYWLTLPCSTKNSNSNKLAFINHIKHENGVWETTDGHRLHSLFLETPFENGIYRIDIKTKTKTILTCTSEPVNFPNTSSFWPEHSNYTTIPYSSDIHSFFTKLVRAMPESLTLDFYYVKDVLGNGEYWDAYIYNNRQSMVVFESHNKLALVMPRKIGAPTL